MEIEFKRTERIIRCGDRTIKAWSAVRNELNHQRPRAGSPDLCLSIGKDGRLGPPTMPRPFPLGAWHVTGIIPHLDVDAVTGEPMDPYLWPYFIATDAWQELDEWDVDAQGYYIQPSGRKIIDSAYGAHYSSSRTTTGCTRIELEEDLRWLVDQIHPRLADGERISFTVVE